MKSKDKKNFMIALCVLVILLVVAGVGFYIAGNLKREEKSETNLQPGETGDSQDIGDTIFYKGKEYRYNKDLNNILFMGVDKTDEVSIQQMVGKSGQADCIMIISINRADQTARILQISRDAMTDIDLYDVSGNYFTSVKAQIATQYAYGNGAQSSCWATKKTVSELLYDLPIDGYLSMNLEGIQIMNDAVGGVTLTIPQDYTSVDPLFVQGCTLTLTGEQAERYVRYRDIEQTGSNMGRMERQLQYIPALLEAAKTRVGEAGDFYGTYSSLLDPYLVTDMSAKQINALARCKLLTDETEMVPGEVVEGYEHDEFYVDDEKLYEIIMKLFYKPVD